MNIKEFYEVGLPIKWKEQYKIIFNINREENMSMTKNTEIKAVSKRYVNQYNKLAYFSLVIAACFLASASNAYAVYDLADVKTELVDKGWAFLDSVTPFIAVGGGLLGAFFARNMDWGMRAAGFGTGTIGFGLAIQGVKAYYGI